MSDIPEAMGTAAAGGLLASAVEGEGSTVSKRPSGEPGTCLNCGALLTGAHCHGCGQKASVHRSLKAIGHDLMHGVLHLDGKLWRTLPLLTLKPGKLTRRYIDGERAKFVSPMAMFLFSVFLMFAVFQAAGISTPTDLDINPETQVSFEEAKSKAQTQLDTARGSLAALDADDPARADLEAQIARFEDDLEGIATAEELAASVGAELTAEAAGAESDAEAKPKFDFNGTGIKSIDEGLIKKWRENPGLMLYKLQTNAYKFSWLLIPLSIPFVWVLFFWKRRFKAYDHAVFVTYSISFMSLLFLVLSVLGIMGAPMELVILSGIFIPPAHIYKQLRYSYDLSRQGAFWRTMALSNGIVFVVLTLFLWLLVLLGAL